MKKIIIPAFVAILVVATAFGTQLPDIYKTIEKTEHTYKNLSNSFDIKVLFKRLQLAQYESDAYAQDSCVVQLTVSNKADATILDVIEVTSLMYYSSFFTDTTNVMSYSTQINTNKDWCDNYFGDIIVADFNFDGRDDIVVVNDMGGNGGCFYSYFIQQKNNKFVLDKFLTSSMIYFPAKINAWKRTLTTYVHASAYSTSKTVYQLNNQNKWFIKSHQFIDDNNPEKDEE